MVGGPVERRLGLCCRGIPHSAPDGLFLFGKILLLNPVAPSVQGRACLLTHPTSPARPGTIQVRAQHAQLSPAGAHGLQCVYHTSSLFPSLRPQATRSLSVLLKPCSAGEGAVNLALSQESCSRPSEGLGL